MRAARERVVRLMARLLEASGSPPDAGVIAEAARLLRAGDLVAFPTETVYGLGANALDVSAVRRIFAAKGRPSYNPLIVHVADASRVHAGSEAVVREWPPLAQALADRFWPGPLTLVLPKAARVPDEVTAGRDSVAVRVPAHPVARALLEAVGLPIAAPSANRFTELSPVTAQQVQRSLGDRVALILDGGRAAVGIESTVVDLTVHPPMLLRPGTITRAALEALTGPLASPAAPASEEAPRAGPGMIARHYAPRATVRLVRTEVLYDALRDTLSVDLNALSRDPTGTLAAQRREFEWTVITWSRAGAAAALPFPQRVALPDDAVGYAAALYDTLHAIDAAGCPLVFVEAPPDDPAWDGVRDRLTRAAHP